MSSRTVVCVDMNKTEVPNIYCQDKKPKNIKGCSRVSCQIWHPSQWNKCPVTCETDEITKEVTCRDKNQQLVDPTLCEQHNKQDPSIPCSNKECAMYRWEAGPWSECSRTCGFGRKHRSVTCLDQSGQRVSTHLCDNDKKLKGKRRCSEFPCPYIWNTGPWSECSVTCGEGKQTRTVVCQAVTKEGWILPGEVHYGCRPEEMPSSSRYCNYGDCSSRNHWTVEPWGECSAVCGHGYQRRQVNCMDKNGEKTKRGLCIPLYRPLSSRPCYNGHCFATSCRELKQLTTIRRDGDYQLKVGNQLVKRPVTCETDEITKEVTCRDKNQQLVDPTLCEQHNKQDPSIPCSNKECAIYRWEAGPWSECSRTCGFGRKHRSVTCVDQSGQRVSTHLCDNDKKLKGKRRCSEFPCPYIWNTGPWSECSVTCGEGKQTRTVVCQAVTKEGWILPGEVHYGCRPEEMPSSSRYCNYGDCSSRNHWTVEPWGECSAVCGHGYQRRQVNCMDKNDEKTKRGLCIPLYRPISSRPCYNGHCYATSCKEFKQLTTIRRDGDYQLKVGNQLVKIYCSDMRKREPREYISLPQGPGENFSETFDKKLRKPGTCPYGGERQESGNSTFSKIRIDLSTLTVSNDAFSATHAGKFVPYATSTSGDCYSSSNCPQGQFSINLVDTGFMVSVNTTWIRHGNRESQRIRRLRDGQIIRGVCEGYCEVCSPDSKVGLKLELLR